jgi:hypothetical protein
MKKIRWMTGSVSSEDGNVKMERKSYLGLKEDVRKLLIERLHQLFTDGEESEEEVWQDVKKDIKEVQKWTEIFAGDYAPEQEFDLALNLWENTAFALKEER